MVHYDGDDFVFILPQLGPKLLTLEAVEEQVRELHNQCLGCFGMFWSLFVIK